MSIISRNIERLRKERGFSQEYVAGELGITRQTYLTIESGKRDPNASEIQKLSALLNTPIQTLFGEPRDNDKFKQMYFYVLKCLGKAVPKSKLAKLLYLADFRNFYEELEPMSGVQYVRRSYGPVADIFFELTDVMYDNGEINIDKMESGAMMISSRSIAPDETLLTDVEKRRIREICALWRDRRTEEIMNFTHGQKPWKACRDGEYIPYSLITQEDPHHVYTPVDERR
ncbi:MAG: helix-turn-helix domain-containing protein [Oscillospiraceae bacterium]|jgi:putative transcriptional regulator|nr:helix-turn-helix domain-containing protein [Oscillospiraceae bacterium]